MFTRSRNEPRRRLSIWSLAGVLLPLLTILSVGWTIPASAASNRPALELDLNDAPVPDSVFKVVVYDDDCPHADEEFVYSSIDDAVKDTVPGEWWHPTGYGYPWINGAAKSAAIIIRTRIMYQVAHWDLYPGGGKYSTYNIDLPAGEKEEDWPGCGDAQMNTILPNSQSQPNTGGRRWGDPNTPNHPYPNYQSNAAVDSTNGLYIIDDASNPYEDCQDCGFSAGWNPAIETRVVQCNYYSRDWAFCAKNALIEQTTYPHQGNTKARRLSNEPTNRFNFQSEARNTFAGRSPPCSINYWFWSNYSPDGDGSDGSTWHGSHFMKAEPNNGCAFGSTQGYELNSAYMTYKVPFPQSGVWYVWIRGKGGSINDDSVHVSLDGPGGNALDMTGWDVNVWRWSNTRHSGARATVTMSGDPFHTLTVWM